MQSEIRTRSERAASLHSWIPLRSVPPLCFVAGCVRARACVCARFGGGGGVCPSTCIIFTDSTSALSLSNKLGLNKRSKHIALRYLFAQDIQATGLVNIQRVTSHNNPADIYTKCVTSPVLERHLRHNGLVELHIEEGEINYFHILELAEQYFNVTSDEDVEYTREQQQRMKNNDQYTKEQRLRVQQKIRKQMRQLYS